RHRELHGLADRGSRQSRSGGDPLRRGQPGRRAAQAQLERVQPGPARSTHRRLRRDARGEGQQELVLMTASELAAVADLAGYSLSTADLEEVAAILTGMMEDIQRLRDLDLPDEVEPIVTFRVEPWA